jgi:hypothetical protein
MIIPLLISLTAVTQNDDFQQDFLASCHWKKKKKKKEEKKGQPTNSNSPNRNKNCTKKIDK